MVLPTNLEGLETFLNRKADSKKRGLLQGFEDTSCEYFSWEVCKVGVDVVGVGNIAENNRLG